MLLSFGASCQPTCRQGPEHGRTIPLADLAQPHTASSGNVSWARMSGRQRRFRNFARIPYLSNSLRVFLRSEARHSLREPTMTVTTGMVGRGFYNRHSAPQWAAIDYVLPWLEDALASMTLPPTPNTITLADFGCSEGRNSIVAMQRLLPVLRRRTLGRSLRYTATLRLTTSRNCLRICDQMVDRLFPLIMFTLVRLQVRCMTSFCRPLPSV